MNFDFSEDQKFLKEQANKFLTDKCDTSVFRSVLNDAKKTHAEDLWKAIVEMGWTGTTIPEEFGGLGLGHLDLCMIAEELGRAVAPVPFSSSVYLATEGLLMGGDKAQKEKYLPRLATGEIIGTLAMGEGAKPPLPRNIEVTFKDGKLNGVKVPVPDGSIADFALVVASTGGNTESDIALVLVDLNGDGVTRETIETLDPSRDHARLTFDNAAGEVVGSVDAGWALTRRILDRAAVLFAFEQIGGADKALEVARDYTLERRAFGRQIATYQAIKHKLADAYIANVLARSNSYYAAWALSTDAPELGIAAATARISATDAFHYAAKECIQVHGGIGYTWEVDCHLYYRRSKLLALTIGGLPAWQDRLVSQLEHANAA
jgi:alkylation response protein AidB-like acyl-CoA dehydrogenase